MKLKFLSIVFLILTVALTGVKSVSADAPFDIERVAVDGTTVYENGDAINVQRGQDAVIEVWLTGNATSDRTTIKAWIGGYEYGSVKSVSDIFEIEPNVKYRKVLRLSIPEDLQGSDDYTLHVEVYNEDDEIEKSYVLRVKEARHSLKVYDILFRPSESIQAGHALFTTVRVENMGYKKEEDIKVTVRIPELGIYTSSYIDELVAYEENGDDEEDSASSNELLLRIPDDAKTGIYNVEIKVEYNRGHDVITETKTIYVQSAKEEQQSIINIDSTIKELKAGEEVIYKLMLTNLGTEKTIYSIRATGVESWATANIQPSYITVDPDSTGEVYIYIKANKDATEGTHLFTIDILSGTQTIKQISVTGNVVKEGFELTCTSLRSLLLLTAAVLVILLIVLGLIVAFKKMSEGKGSEEEPSEISTAEGQTYYYYPRQ